MFAALLPLVLVALQGQEPTPPAGSTDLAAERALLADSQRAVAEGDPALGRKHAGALVAALLPRIETTEDPALVQLLEFAGVAAWHAQDPGLARRAWEAVVVWRERELSEEDPLLVQVRGNLSAALKEFGELDRALDLDRRVLAAREKRLHPDDPEIQWARTALGLSLLDRGELHEAAALLEQVLEVDSRTLPPDDLDLQRDRINFAACLKRLGQLARARELEEQALEVLSRTVNDEHPVLQTVRGNLGNSYRAEGDLARARALHEHRLAVAERVLTADNPDLLMAREHYALTMQDLGDNAAARAMLEGVLAARLRSLPEDDGRVQMSRLQLAAALGRAYDYAGARVLLEQARAVAERVLPEGHSDRLAVVDNLSLVLVNQGELEEARDLQQQAFEQRRHLAPAHPDRLLAQGNLASTLNMLGENETACALAEEVLALRLEVLPEGHPHLQIARRNLSVILLAMAASDAHGEPGLAAWSRARELLGEGLRSASDEARRVALTTSRREAEERCALLAEILDLALSVASGYGELAPAPELAAEAFVLSEASRAAALAAGALARRAQSSPELALLRERWRTASARLAQALESGAGREEYVQALAARDAAERALQMKVQALGASPLSGAALDSTRVAAALTPSQVAVAYRRYLRAAQQTSATEAPASRRPIPSLCAFVVRPAGAQSEPHGGLALVDLGPLAPIEAAVDSWCTALGSAAGRGVAVTSVAAHAGLDQAGAAIRSLAFDPLAAHLGASREVVLVQDDVLHLVPFDALPAPSDRVDGARCLGETLRITLRASLAELLATPASPAEAGVLIAVGGVDYDGDAPAAARGPAGVARLAPLPATAVEARGVIELFRALSASEGEPEPELLTGSAASVAALAAAAPRARWLHVATHGWTTPGPTGGDPQHARRLSPLLFCGLALAGANLPVNALGRAPGLLTADELSTLDLASCELAVLSACDTARGERLRAGQGVASLQKALQMAGARSVITSLWKVPDEATKELMLDFYRRVWIEKQPKWQALWEAKLALRDAQDDAGRPRYSLTDWGAWVLTGEPE